MKNHETHNEGNELSTRTEDATTTTSEATDVCRRSVAVDADITSNLQLPRKLLGWELEILLPTITELLDDLREETRDE